MNLEMAHGLLIPCLQVASHYHVTDMMQYERNV